MQITERRLSDIKPYEKNPRRNDAAVEYVAESLRQFGWKQPIVIDKDGVIVAGHTRYKAALSLGMETAPCLIADDLTPEQVKAYRLADNKVGEIAEWDFDLLDIELENIEFDMSDFGFDMDGVSLDEETEAVEDDYDAQPPAEPKTKRGDIYQLGRHRLMCGDSTEISDVRRLMDGTIADIAFASPPYNAGFGANITKDNGRKSKYIDGDDNVSADEYAGFLGRYIDNANAFSKYNFVNLQMLANNKTALWTTINERLHSLADVIVWDKTRSQPSIAKNVLNSEFEFVFCFSQKGKRSIGTIPFHGNLANIIHIPPGRNEFSDVHNAVFPVALPFYFIDNFAKISVLDLFGGTGTTMIAAEQLGRNCYMMELEPRYCDVIVDRWERLTGEKAVLIQ